MKIKKIVGTVHLWLGMISGLVVFIVAITGCLYAFQYELQEMFQSFRHVEPRTDQFQLPTKLKSVATAELPGYSLHSIAYEGGERSATAYFYGDDPLYYYAVYMDPYTGEVLKVKDITSDFFYQVLQGHYYLWLPPAVGQPVVACSTLIFTVMLITGVVLWWPKNKKNIKQRFTIKWNGKWRRKNYDLHSVFGFYSLFIALVLALTGLVWGFEWFGNFVYRAAGGDKNYVYTMPSSRSPKDIAVTDPEDKLWLRMMQEYPEAQTIEVHFVDNDTSALEMAISTDRETYWSNDYRYFDQRTLEEIEVNEIYGPIKKATVADKLIRMNYDIHTGAIWGLPGKILMFFASLVVASLPITGFMIWYGRRNKQLKEKEKKLELGTMGRL